MIEGKWHEEGSAAQVAATLRFETGRYSLSTESDLQCFGSLEKVIVSDRLGNVERKLTLEDGSVFATRDNDSVDLFFKQFVKKNSIIHAIESNMAWVAVALILTIASTFSFFKWGVPWAGHTIAHALPQETNDLIGAQTLKFLDDYLFEPSELPQAQRTRIRTHFLDSIVPLSNSAEAIDYKLHFRAWGEDEKAIPNALALPSGDIILTDKFVELSENQLEIDSVLLHEMGHIEHRHTLESLVQGTIVTAAVVLFTGDLSGISDIGVGFGTLLLSTSYSRHHESQADQYAFEHMLRAKMDPTSFADIMQRITRHSPSIDSESSSAEANEESHDENSAQEQGASEKSGVLDYLSTHPSTADRVQQARRYAQCYRKGLIVCDVLKSQ